ncbi:uncharacterized protein LOC115764368 [Drosophila novamexicana]|uniref:uncharacterized protein LOC115764368 n=1 Tax=Drosophila novamexicana TaxID=47314 RepID=UPI0011E5A22C|nr:uncharacterized protein LOC115764368 [Drosophila novamexicana]
MPSQTPGAALTFKIKLLSGNNVVLVDCVGFESELFMPQIIKGRITFQNIIPNHRCCDAAAANVQTGQLILPASKLGDVRVVAGAGTPQRFNLEQHIANISGPLARSTPSSGTSVRAVIRADKENFSLLLTPEQARCKPVQKSTLPIPVSIDSILPFLESSSAASPVANPSLPVANDSAPRPASTSSSALSAKTGDTAKCNFMHKAPPVRTYARRKPNTTNTQPKGPISWSPLQKKKKLAKVSSTKPPSPSMKLEVRHRKLIVDQKKSLAASDTHKITAVPITKTKIRRKQVTGKTRQQFEALKGTAFDMLTSPGHSHVSIELSKQFKDACVEKYSETLPSYAELSGTAPLEHDRQVKSLIAKEKRLEKQMSKSEQARLLKRKRI